MEQFLIEVLTEATTLLIGQINEVLVEVLLTILVDELVRKRK
jgi:hypothetical protein